MATPIVPKSPSLPEKEAPTIIANPHLYECFKKIEVWMQQTASWMTTMGIVPDAVPVPAPIPSSTAPIVLSISPASGDEAGGTPVTISGTGFTLGATATVGGIALTGLIVVSPTSITGTTGAHAAGAVDVVVTNFDTQTGTLTNGFEYTATPPPPGIPYVLTETLGTARNDVDAYVGFYFNTDANTPTVTHLGRWKINGNTASHLLYLYQYVDGISDIQVAAGSVNTTLGADDEYQYDELFTPVTLLAGTIYYIQSHELNAGDEWYSDDTTLDTFSPSIGSVIGSCATTTLGIFGDLVASPGSIGFGPVNIKVSA